MVRKFWVVFLMLITSIAFAQAASRMDGDTVIYYNTLHEAVEDCYPPQFFFDHIEINLLMDVVLDEPLIIDNNMHITLIASGVTADGGLNRTIRRGGGNIEFPVIWVKGDNASLTLGSMSYEQKTAELIIDGGYVSAGYAESIKAHAPLAAVSGPGAKLIMYDGVTLQNNFNSGYIPQTSHYKNGAGVFIRTEGDIEERPAEFIMKGGTIKGNIIDALLPTSCGAGVFISGFGIFTMEGGIIMNNTARSSGGGLQLESRGSFTKTGGVIYGSDAPLGLRNIALEGNPVLKTVPLTYGHAVCVVLTDYVLWFRNNTVNEKDNLSYTGAFQGNGIFGEGEKWNNSKKVSRLIVLIIVVSVLAACIIIFLIIKTALKKHFKAVLHTAESAPEIDFSCFNLTDREKEVCSLLLTDLNFKDIAAAIGISKATVSFHANNLYRKLEIQSRTELYVKLGKKT